MKNKQTQGMKKSIKAALFSAAIYPGAGHFWLKQKVSGVVLAGVATYTLYHIFVSLMQKAQDIAQKIVTGEVPPDIATITALIHEQSAGSEQVETMTTVLIISWLVGIADSYRVGRLQDKLEKIKSV